MEHKKFFQLEWDEMLGEHWMNLDNLAILLFTKACAKKELLTVKEVGFVLKEIK